MSACPAAAGWCTPLHAAAFWNPETRKAEEGGEAMAMRTWMAAAALQMNIDPPMGHSLSPRLSRVHDSALALPHSSAYFADSRGVVNKDRENG